MIRDYSVLAVTAALVAAGPACRTPGSLTPDELRMTVAQHEQAAAAEDAHTPGHLGGVPGIDHRESAEAHRAAARSLRERELQACAGVPETGVSHPLSSAAVVTVEPIRQSWSRTIAPAGHGQPPARLSGARLVVHTSLPPDVFESHLTCRAAHVSASGDDGTDPTVVHGARVSVAQKEPTLLVVDVRADDEVCAEEVLRRAQRLVAR